MGSVFSAPGTIVGHRGLGKGTVEGHQANTLGSFLAALDAGATWVEVDVRRAADDELFVVHDEAFPDHTHLAQLTGIAVRALGALPLSTLLEALPLEAGVIFDVKSSFHDAGRPAGLTTAALLGETCRQMLKGRPALAQSFDPAALQQLRSSVPDLPLGLLTWIRYPIGLAVAAAAHLDVQALALHAGSLNPGRQTGSYGMPTAGQIVDTVHGCGKELVVWSPSLSKVRMLAAAGVDALIVDDVARHVRAVGDQRLPQEINA